MGEHRRKADGRRRFSTEFKRATVQRGSDGGEDSGRAQSRARHRAECDPQLEAVRGGGGDDGGAGP